MKIRSIFIQYKWRFALIFSLILIESIIVLFIPLFIGYSIDGVIEGEYLGTFKLGILGLLIILIGGGRRYYDSRFYAKLYRDLGSKMLFSQVDQNQISVKTARLGMINEIIEFLENSLPALVSTIISVLDVIFIIATLDFEVFIVGIIATFLIYLIYFLTKGRTTYLNKLYNNEIEKQVDVITDNNKEEFKIHLKNLMKWNIKLSDLEVFNFSLS